jgi:endonuclease/exonuclease/phosphatase family metal-dependent hydrolase
MIKILFSNIGYAKGIDGTLQQHFSRLGRHLYCDLPVQRQALAQLKAIIDTEKPDICCLVEIDRGSFHSAYFNQVMDLIDDNYPYHDIADKYGENSLIGKLPFHRGKSNAFLSKQKLSFDRLYFSHGTKRLIYKLSLSDDITVYFAHFSLQRKVRLKQFQELRSLIAEAHGESIILADFNIMQGFKELDPLLEKSDLEVLNKEDEHTFKFHKRELALDLCVCSKNLARRTTIKVIPQPFSDHEALLVSVHDT